jgi:RNA polymerase sigma-70 factor (ECF subfamily)
LLDRIRNPQDQEAWADFVGIYGPLIFHFARRRLPQDDDAADVTQDVLGAVLCGRYERTGGFQKWLLTITLNKIRDFYEMQNRRHEMHAELSAGKRLEEQPARAEEEWREERQRQLFHAAAERVRARSNPTHWDAFVRTALEQQSGQEVSDALDLSVTNVYAIRSRIIKEIKDEIAQFGDNHD